MMKIKPLCKMTFVKLCVASLFFFYISQAHQSLAAESSDTELFIDVGRAGTRKLKMAIPVFGSEPGTAVT
jgi:hypothetical protein